MNEKEFKEYLLKLNFLLTTFLVFMFAPFIL